MQLKIKIEMREKHDNSDGSRLIDKFQIDANSSNCNKAMSVDGELGIASIVFKIELRCAQFEVSACELPTDTTLDECSKIYISHTCELSYISMSTVIWSFRSSNIFARE